MSVCLMKLSHFVCLFWNSHLLGEVSGQPTMRSKRLNLMKVSSVLEKTLEGNHVFPGQLAEFHVLLHDKLFFRADQLQVEDLLVVRKGKENNVEVWKWVTGSQLWTVACLAMRTLVASSPSLTQLNAKQSLHDDPVYLALFVFQVLLFIVLFMEKRAIKQRFGLAVDNAFSLALLFFQSIGFILFFVALLDSFTTSDSIDGSGISNISTNGCWYPTNATFWNDSLYRNLDPDWAVCNWTGSHAVNGERPYPVCMLDWGSQEASISALDLAQISTIMYSQLCWKNETNSDSIQHNLEQAFGTDSQKVSLVNCSNYSTFPRYAVIDFWKTGPNSSKKTRVLAFKGTSTSTDIFKDMTFWSVVKVLQLFEGLVPIVHLLPMDQIQWMLYQLRLWSFSHREEVFWHRLVELSRMLLVLEKDRDVVVTGHSLGGGIAQVVAARLNLPVLTFSAPGIGYSVKRFGISDPFPGNRTPTVKKSFPREHSIHPFLSSLPILSSILYRKNATVSRAGIQASFRNSFNIVPQFDIVPRVDAQVAMEQRVDCRNSGRFGGIGDCHSITKTACELWRVCGETRNVAVDCSREMKVPPGISLRTMLGGYFLPDDSFEI